MKTCPIKLSRPRVAIFDLTDCEGCELQILSMEEKMLKFIDSVEVVNWRLVHSEKDPGPYDICFIEGTVITREEEKLVKLLRENSKIVIALGACACLGGVAALIKEKNRKKLTKYVYGETYQSLAKDAKPLNHYIKVDYYFNGCPVSRDELEEWFADLLAGKQIKLKSYPVCYECKAKENECLLLKGKPCLGPITLGGCGAICPSQGIRCYGCWGPSEQANFPAMVNALKKQGRKPAEIKQIMEIFFEEREEFRKIKKIR